MAVKIILSLLLVVAAAEQRDTSNAAVNPIRKVVTMLQSMTKKVEAEGEKEKEMYEKFMCYCKTSGGDLKTSIADAETKVPAVGSDITEGESKLAQLKSDIKKAQTDRTSAKAAMAQATSLREKEAAEFKAEKDETDTNIAALAKAVGALEKGMSGAFLQTTAAQILRKITLAMQDMVEADRQDVLSFLSGSQTSGYAPQSGEITGILKEMKDTMAKGLAESTATETGAIQSFDELMAAKTKEVAALTAAIESKTVRSGELAVDIVQMKEDLSDTQAALLEDKKFLADMDKNCATKTAEWDEICKTRSEELVALAETIKVLNDDDALELFKKTLPGASASFVQMKTTDRTLRSRALALMHGNHGAQFDFITLALRGKKIGFEKVLKMIDDMAALLKKEQTDDDNKKEYCNTQFDSLDDKKKGLERSVADSETSVATADEAIATLASEIKALEGGITALDKSVAEATSQRKSENEDYKELMASDAAAKEVLGFAKNRLNKFYNPKLYNAPAKRVLSEEERITVNMGGTLAPTAPPGGIAGTGVAVLAQISSHTQHRAAPPPPPDAVGAYQKKSGESTGVISMIDLLVADLDKEMTESQTAEKDAQVDYEQAMSDSAAKRALDSKTLTAKASAKADTQADLESHKDDQASAGKELMATHKVIGALHAECDWLIQNFEARKAARAGEVDSLVKAKAVLSGADFSLVQTKARTLRGQL